MNLNITMSFQLRFVSLLLPPPPSDVSPLPPVSAVRWADGNGHRATESHRPHHRPSSVAAPPPPTLPIQKRRAADKKRAAPLQSPHGSDGLGVSGDGRDAMCFPPNSATGSVAPFHHLHPRSRPVNSREMSCQPSSLCIFSEWTKRCNDGIYKNFHPFYKL